jgi:hypothetical protein
MGRSRAPGEKTPRAQFATHCTRSAPVSPAAAPASPAHDELLVQVAAQVDAPRIEHNAMRDSYLRQVQEDAALIQSEASAGPAHADMGGMDEPDNSADVPAGGFPVPDYD